MGIKYKLRLKDLKLKYLLEYFSPILKYLRPKTKINNMDNDPYCLEELQNL